MKNMFLTLTLAVMCAFGAVNAMTPSVTLEMDKATLVDKSTDSEAFGVKVGLGEMSLSVRGLDHNLDLDHPVFEVGMKNHVLPFGHTLRVGFDKHLDVFNLGMDRCVMLDSMVGLNLGLGVLVDRNDLSGMPSVEARLGLRVPVL